MICGSGLVDRSGMREGSWVRDGFVNWVRGFTGVADVSNVTAIGSINLVGYSLDTAVGKVYTV